MVANEVFKRLPTNVVPEKYFIDYEVIDLMNFRFEGSERVQLRVQEAGTKTITCHALELYVFGVSVELSTANEPNAEPKSLACEQIQYLSKDDTVQFHFAEELPLGALVTLTLRFHGFLNDQLRGFYRSEYDLNKEKRVLAVTQFEACDARRAFVCWDEPAIKAKFVISMVTDADLVALSNMHVVQTLVRPKKNAKVRALSRKDAPVEKLWKFAETPIMSTYLVAMVVGEFDVLTGISKEGVIVNVYTAPGQSERGRFSLDVALRALSFFTERFGIAYPLKKLDMVAIPDFLGAMENWGLATYSESYLLIDEKLSSQQIKMLTARVVCHELSHQWFGNLVTMEWWTGLWLNEGFAQYMEFDAVNYIFPEWKVWESFVQAVMLSSAFVKDAMTTSHPIEVIVNHPHEADEIFDTISYNKGASVVRMLSEFLGPEVFYKGVSEYLVKFSYKNTVTDDLWDSLEKASGVSIKKMASSWTQQMGFPLVTLKEGVPATPSSEGGGACCCNFVVEQERFFADRSNAKDDKSLWDVPLTMITSEDPHTIKRIGIWDAKSSGKFDAAEVQTPVVADDSINNHLKLVSADPTHGWIKLNPSQSSFYLVNYPPSMWKKLQVPVKERIFGVIDRVSMLSSVFTLAGTGVLSVADAFDFTSAYVEEPEFLLWKEMAARVGYYSTLFHDEPFQPELQQYIRTLFARVMAHLTWEKRADSSDSNEGQFRKTVIWCLGCAGDQDVIQEAKRRYHAYMSGDTASLSADIRDVVFRIQAAHGDASHAKQLQHIYETSDFAEEKEDAIIAVGLIPNAHVKQQVLEWGLESVRAQDVSGVFSSVANDKVGSELAWEFIQKNWDVIVKKYSAMNVGGILARVIIHFHSEARAVEVEAFLANKNTAGFARRIEGALETVRVKSQELHRGRESMAQWLKTRSTSSE